MQGNQSTPSQRLLEALERPHCPHCKSRMLLVEVRSDSRDCDYRTFECAKREHAGAITVSVPKTVRLMWETPQSRQ